MRRFLKITLSMFIILGTIFSILNFISTETKADPSNKTGAWVEVNGTLVCAGDGNECDPFDNGFKTTY